MKQNKIKLLFVNDSLGLAGGEKSLISLLTKLDKDMYDIDLQLFRYGGELDAQIPQHVNILHPLDFTVFMQQSIGDNFRSVFKRNHLKYLCSRILYSLKLRGGSYNNTTKAQLYWESVKNSIEKNSKMYDIGIAYSHGAPTFYVNDKINSKKKVAWVNANLILTPKNKIFQKSFYKNYDKIVAVSSYTQKHLEELFPEFKANYTTIYDIVDYQHIVRLASETIEGFTTDHFSILTVARLNKFHKGFDIALEACKILKERQVKFKWYVIGEGPYREEMETFISENKMEDYFIFLGTKKNPYPYFKTADLYVQTSRNEGFGLTIAEARLLNTPVVTTRFDTVYIQMIHEKNGLVTDMNPEEVANAIERMMNDKDLYNSIVEFLKVEQKENFESVEKFDALIEVLLLKK